MRSPSRGQILIVLLAVSIVTVAPAGALSLAVVEETQSDFNAGTTEGGVEVYPDDTVGVRPNVGSTVTADITAVSADDPDGGVTFVPQTNMGGIVVERFGATSFDTLFADVELQDSNGNTLVQRSVQTDKEVEFQYDFTAGTEYQIVYYASDKDAAFGVKNDTALNAPYTSSDIDITGGAGTDLKNVKSITAVPEPKNDGEYETTKTVTDAEQVFVEFAQLDGFADLSLQNNGTTLVDDRVTESGLKEYNITADGTEEYRILIQYFNDIDQT